MAETPRERPGTKTLTSISLRQRVGVPFRRTFSSFSNYNYRLY